MRAIGHCLSRWRLPRRGMVESLRDVRDEMREFLSAPSCDEFHDILWTLSRLGFDLFGWRWLPVTDYCWTKYEARYQCLVGAAPIRLCLYGPQPVQMWRRRWRQRRQLHELVRS